MDNTSNNQGGIVFKGVTDLGNREPHEQRYFKAPGRGLVALYDPIFKVDERSGAVTVVLSDVYECDAKGNLLSEKPIEMALILPRSFLDSIAVRSGASGWTSGDWT
jgi:hypothetical protein